MSDTTLILDFDGTIACKDVGDALCDRFAPPEWRAIDEKCVNFEVPLPDAQAEMWAMVRATPDQFRAAVFELGTFRAGFDRLLARAARDGVRLVIASGGFELYIDQLLGARRHRFEAIWANEMTLTGTGVRVSFPHRETLGCWSDAVCKGRICERYQAQGHRVVYVGDGSSDRCAAGKADRMYCIRGSLLARLCAELGVEAVAIDDFDGVSW